MEQINFVDLEMESLGFRIENEIGTYKRFDAEGNVTFVSRGIPEHKIRQYEEWRTNKLLGKSNQKLMALMGGSDGTCGSATE